jgi:1,4-alpha-glucan branching enzyme
LKNGYLNLVLHAHLPFARHLDKDDRLEERWLFEAMTETYIPLLQVFQRLLDDGVDFRVTISLSPPLISMLNDSLLQSRYEKYLQNLLHLACRERIRTAEDPQMSQLAVHYERHFHAIHEFFHNHHGNILTAFRALFETGRVELITSTATHAFMPYVETEEALRAQIATAVSVFESHFGRRPEGIWLPECAYTPRVLPFLREFSIRYFFVGAQSFDAACPRPVFGAFAPVIIDAKGDPRDGMDGLGVAAFARDSACSEQVWSSVTGYPGDFNYREYYRDIGFDLDESYIGPHIHPEGIRVNTGFKYYRITGSHIEKAPYDVERAREKAAEHAAHFLTSRQQQLAAAKRQMGRTPIVTATYDAELFGHWWYEGPIFIDMLLRKMYYDQNEISTVTPSEYLSLYPDFQSCSLSFSTWGRGGYGDVWLNPTNDWVYPALHDAEHKMGQLATKNPAPSSLTRRALNQAARELMLAQSSDFAFIMDAKSAVDYAVSRTKQHVNRFDALWTMITTSEMDDHYLTELEAIDNLFPDVDYRLYARTNGLHSRMEQRVTPLCVNEVSTADAATNGNRAPRVLMLSWEFPPMSVGGLSRHVYHLACHLVRLGCEVHVVTMAVDGYPLDECVEGVQVHRVQVLKPDGDSFIHFVFQLNLVMLDRCHALIDHEGVHFDLIHAHDWLVTIAAKTLKERTQLPLVATIHATEYGRNQGIFTDTQRHIHHREWVLTYEANRVIVCSSYMRDEVIRLFQLPEEKLDIIANGVTRDILEQRDTSKIGPGSNPYVRPGERMVLFVGRLVREKGVHVLLDAAPVILKRFPDTKFVIVGKGPMQDELVRQADELGVSDRVVFTGYADDELRNLLLHSADATVFPSLYEPFGIVALEAMAAGVPVVASAVGGLSDIVHHDHTGLTTFPGDANSIATQVLRLFANPSLTRHLTKTALSNLCQFDWKNIAEGTVKVYEQATRNVVVSSAT